MTPNASAGASWRTPPRSNSVRRVAKVAVALLVGAIGSQYLAACFFLSSVGLPVTLAKPLTIAQFAYYYGERDDIRRKLTLSSLAALIVVGASGAIAFLPAGRKLHGDARFARPREIAAAGLLGDDGILLGKLGRRFLMLSGQQSVVIAAPPRSGKGVGIVIPNLLNWRGSVLCLDIKRENWTLTAGYRAQCGQQCFLFDPFAANGQTACWSPLAYVAEDHGRRINDLQRIAEWIFPDPPNGDPFWSASARSFFLGLSLYVFETPSLPRTLGEILRQGMANDDEGFGQHWRRVIEGRNAGRFPLSPECVRALCDVMDLAPVTASSIRKTFCSRLDIWMNPILDAATSRNDFDLREMRAKPMSVYVSVNPEDLHRVKPLLNLLLQQSIGLQTRELPEHNPALKHQLLILLDELAAPGAMPILPQAAPFLPGYNVRLVLVFHAFSQLRELYGSFNAETLLKSLAARIAFAPKEFAEAQALSNELGFTTVKVKTHSRPAMDFDSRDRRSRSVSISEQRRALLLPQEVKELGNEEAIVFYEGLRPIRCRKIRYFSDARFRKRLLPPPAQAAPRITFVPRAPSSKVSSRPLPEMDAGAERAPVLQKSSRSSFAPSEHSMRDATVEDVERIGSLTLEDFGIDFSKVDIPDHGGPLSDVEMKKAVSSFLDTLGV